MIVPSSNSSAGQHNFLTLLGDFSTNSNIWVLIILKICELDHNLFKYICDALMESFGFVEWNNSSTNTNPDPFIFKVFAAKETSRSNNDSDPGRSSILKLLLIQLI